MAKNLGDAVISLLTHERAEMRAATATVLAAVGRGNRAVIEGLTERLADSEASIRKIALEGLASLEATGIAGALVPLVRGRDEALAVRAAEVLAAQGSAAESTLRKEVGSGPVPARRTIAQLLLRRGSVAAVEAVLDQLGDPEFGESALQLVRAEIDAGADKLRAIVEKSAALRASESGKEVHKAWGRAVKAAEKASAGPKGKPSNGNGKGRGGGVAPSASAADPMHDAQLAQLVTTHCALLRLIGYLAQPSSQSMLLGQATPDRPRAIRLAAIAALRRLVARSEAKGTEAAISAMIEYANDPDGGVAQAAIDTLRGARIPEKLAKEFGALARSKNVAAQKLAMERLPAGGGATAIKALIDALGGSDPTARDAAARGLAKAPEAVMAMVKVLVECTDETIARRYASAIRSHRGNVSNAAIEALVEYVRGHLDRYFKGKATAESMVLERVAAELIADLAPTHHVELLFERAKRLRKAGKVAEAFGSLKPLLRSHADIDAAIDDDHRFLLALFAIEAAGDGVLRLVSGDSPVLAQFARLSEGGYPVAKKLAKERDVSDEAIYGLGFALIESQAATSGELGAELLQGIIDERPRSKLAKAAKNKLRLAGYLDE